MKLHLIILLALLPSIVAAQELSIDDLSVLSSEQIESRLPSSHPAVLYAYAGQLYAQGRPEDSVLWFYAGQLRFRFDLMARPDQDPSAAPALFAALNESLGLTINEWAGGDIDMWCEQMEKALEWDAREDNGYTSKTDYAQAHQDARAGLVEMIGELRQNKEKFRQMRATNGLSNRVE